MVHCGVGELALRIVKQKKVYKPVKIDNRKWKIISHFTSLAIQQDGSLWALEDNENGQFDDGTTRYKIEFVPIGVKTVEVTAKTIDINRVTHLKKGIHLIGSSYEVNNSNIFHYTDYIFVYDRENNTYKVLDIHQTGKLADKYKPLDKIPAKSGFWVYNATDDHIDINYTKEILPKDKQEHITKTYLDTLPKGWHMIGTSYQINSSKALFSQESGIKRVLIFTEGQYKDITDKETTIPPYSGISLFKE